MGEDPFGPYLDEIVRGEKIGELPIIVRRYQDVKDIEYCHVIFINKKEGDKIKEILVSVSNRRMLTVSDDPAFLQQGGIIRFFTEKNKIRMQINKAAAEREQVTISSKLLNVSQVVHLKSK
ncbi:MAG: YfiR family protein [Chitinophagaceae bacterium]